MTCWISGPCHKRPPAPPRLVRMEAHSCFWSELKMIKSKTCPDISSASLIFQIPQRAEEITAPGGGPETKVWLRWSWAGCVFGRIIRDAAWFLENTTSCLSTGRRKLRMHKTGNRRGKHGEMSWIQWIRSQDEFQWCHVHHPSIPPSIYPSIWCPNWTHRPTAVFIIGLMQELGVSGGTEAGVIAPPPVWRRKWGLERDSSQSPAVSLLF